MDVKLLGALETDPPLQGGGLQRMKERGLLAVLALTPGQPVTAETLISKVWDDDANTQSIRNTLRSYMVRVKGAVTAVGGASVESAPGGYVLRIDRENVDVHRFRRLVRQAEAIAASGDAERAVSLLREADGLWRGQALADLRGRWIESMRHRLHEERRRALERRVGLELELGRHADLIGELWELIERFSHAETWISFQMLALYLDRREEDALALYQRDYERRIETGLDPSPGLSALQERILRHDPSLAATPAGRRPARRARPNGGLPPRPEAVVGRDRELAVLCDVSDPGTPPVRIVHGMGGIGKTALAVEAAYRLRDRYPDPPLLLRFHAHEAGQVPVGAREALCRLLELSGITPESSPRNTAALAAAWQREIAQRRSVIVLDDVPDATAITSILPVAGESVVIVTSRSRLAGPPGSVVISLEELAEDDAIDLFTRIAGSSKIDDPGLLPRAARLCGCLPLALTMSASRLRDQEPAVSEFVAEIEERRTFSDHSGMAVPELTKTFEFSYSGLDQGHREFFRRLGVNPCLDFSPGTAAVLVGTTATVAESALRVLYGRHLIERPADNRYRFHDLIREYAEFVAARDDPGWERRRAMRRLLDHYLNSARRAAGILYPYRRRAGFGTESSSAAQPEPISAETARKWFEEEWRNIVRLADYAAHHEWKQYCADLSDAVADFLDSCGYWSDGADIHRTSLKVCDELGDPLLSARSAKSLSLFEWRTGNYRDALSHAEEAAEMFRSKNEVGGVAESLDRMGVINFYIGQTSAALAYHQEALELYREIHDEHGVADALCNAGTAHFSLGRYAEAVTNHENAISLYRKTGDRRGEARCYNNIGDAFYRQGLSEDALHSYEKALRIYKELGARQHVMTVRLNIAHVDQNKGRYQEAIAAYRAALAVCRDTGDLHLMARTLYDIGTAYQSQEHYGQALVCYQEAEVIAKRIGNLGIRAVVSLGIADSSRGNGDYDKALEYYSMALDAALQTEDILQKAKVLEGMAETRFRMRDLTTARILLRKALDAFQTAHVPEAEKVELRLAVLGSDMV